jgi:integrase
LANEVACIDAELRYNTNHRHRFVDCAERYLAESKHRRSVDVAAWHVRLLTPYIGMLETHRIHDATLKSFIADRLASGLREGNVCGLEWSWEVPVPEVGRGVFVIPRETFKTNRPHVAILNDIAWSVIEAQRGQHPIWVFPYQGERVSTMNNTAWQRARSEVSLAGVRIHDLRHYADVGISVTRSDVDCAPPAYPPKIGKLYLATPIIPWPATTRVRMSVACSSRRTWS